VTKWLQFVGACSVFLLLIGALFLLEGAWRSYRQYFESTKWPAVEARVVRCSISGSWHSGGTPASRNIAGETLYVRCTLAYQSEGLKHESTLNVGDTIFFLTGKKLFTPRITAAAMHEWIARHPPGSVLAVHYDPSDPNRISIAGADRELRAYSPKDRLQLGIFVITVGTVLLAVTTLARKRLLTSVPIKWL